MLVIDKEAAKLILKSGIPKKELDKLKDALKIIDKTKDLTLFNITEMKGDYSKIYYRIRKGKYRAIFYFDDDNTILDFIGKREDIYKLWQQSK